MRAGIETSAIIFSALSILSGVTVPIEMLLIGNVSGA
jgi:hypothetical protein